MSQEEVDGYYGGDELSLVNFSDLEPDEILQQKYTKGRKRWLLVSFRSKQNDEHFGRLVFSSIFLFTTNLYIYTTIFQHRHFCLWLPAESTTSDKIDIPEQNE